MARAAGCLLLLGVLLFSPAPAWAIPAPMSPHDLMAASDLVALVRVLAVTCVGVFKDGHTGENLPSYQAEPSHRPGEKRLRSRGRHRHRWLA